MLTDSCTRIRPEVRHIHRIVLSSVHEDGLATPSAGRTWSTVAKSARESRDLQRRRKEETHIELRPRTRCPHWPRTLAELFGRWPHVLEPPRLGAASDEVEVSPMMESPDTSICMAPPGVIRHVSADGKDRVEIGGSRRRIAPGSQELPCGTRNDHRTVDLAARHPQQGGKHHGRQSAHTSKTHRHPKGHKF